MQAGGWGSSYLVPKRTFLFQRKHIKFYLEDALQNLWILQCIHKLLNIKTCIKHQVKRKISLPILFFSPLELNQRFKTRHYLYHQLTLNCFDTTLPT